MSYKTSPSPELEFPTNSKSDMRDPDDPTRIGISRGLQILCFVYVVSCCLIDATLEFEDGKFYIGCNVCLAEGVHDVFQLYHHQFGQPCTWTVSNHEALQMRIGSEEDWDEMQLHERAE